MNTASPQNTVLAALMAGVKVKMPVKRKSKPSRIHRCQHELCLARIKWLDEQIAKGRP